MIPSIDLPPADIFVVGLGPGPVSGVTLGAWRAMMLSAVCGAILLRTGEHPCVPWLAEHFALLTCDDLYEAHDDFADVYAAIAERVLRAAVACGGAGGEAGPVVYAVPGHPWVGEQTTALICEGAASQGLRVEILGAESFIEPTFAAVGVDAMDGAQTADAMLLAQQHYPPIDVGAPLLVAQLFSRALASDLKLALMGAYPAEHPVTLVRRAGTAQQETLSTTLNEIDHHEHDHLTSLYVPPVAEQGSLFDLLEVVAHLRAPEGCPWDREQTLHSLRGSLIDEAAEVVEAIDLDTVDMEAHGLDNSRHIAEELGDLLLNVVMLTQIAVEEERFQLADVARGITQKLIRRHPHVFGSTEIDGIDELYTNWDAIKAQEKAERGEVAGPLDGIPATLPALEKARKLQSKALKAGLLDGEALLAESAWLNERLADEDDLATLLWQAVAVAKSRGWNAEDALREYGVRFRAMAADVEAGV